MPALTPELLLPRLAPLPGARIGWVAYSGGMDSAVLLHALAAIRHRLAFELHALHIDHGLHENSHAWAEHCAGRCKRLGVPIQTRRAAVVAARGESLEAVARRVRYETMAESLGQGDLLLTAQHLDDQAETLLLALMRGSGPAGLAAMPSVAPLGAGRLVRPLLEHSRAELLEYARSQRLEWLEDPANQDLRFDRNFLRHRVLPRLAERWPSCATSIARSASHCGSAQGILDLVAKDELTKAAGRRPGTLSIERLLNLDSPPRKLVLRHWFRELDLAPPAARHLDRIVTEVMTARADANPLVAWRGCEVRRYRGDLFAMAPLPPAPAPGPLPWSKGILVLPNGLGSLELLASDWQAVDPLDMFASGLDVQFGVQGLVCRPAPGGHSRSLKKLFQDAAVPSWVRPYVPLLFAAGKLIAVGGICVCHRDAGVGERGFQIRWQSDLCDRLPRDILGA